MTALRLATAASLFLLAACAGNAPSPSYDTPDLALSSDSGIVTPASPLQCVSFARERSGIDLSGDAFLWWDLAADKYARASAPIPGSVIVLTGYGEKRAHLAVVREIVSPRLIHVDHANWLNDGRIYLGNPLVDVSPNNDWSQVRVYNLRDRSWGLRNYAVQGFISNFRASSPS